jgi:hypothetical protein
MPETPRQVAPLDVEAAVDELKRELHALANAPTQRIDCNEETIEKGLARLVLSLVELLRKLMERQAIRRMEGGSLDDRQIEEMGLALMKLEQKVYEIAAQFGLQPEDLNLDLGPLGRLHGE